MTIYQAVKYLRFTLFLTAVIALMPTPHAAAEGKSRRVIRDELTTQESTEVGASASTTSPTSTVSASSGLVNAGSPAAVTYAPASPGTSTATAAAVALANAKAAAKAKSSQQSAATAMQIIQGFMASQQKAAPAAVTPPAAAAAPVTTTPTEIDTSGTADESSVDTSMATEFADKGFSNTSISKAVPKRTRMDGADRARTCRTSKEDDVGRPTPWQPPTSLPFQLTSCFGERAIDGVVQSHEGIDLVMTAKKGQKNWVVPAYPGRVVSSEFSGGYGCQVVIEHDSCPTKKGTCYTRYAHLEKENGACPDLKGQFLGSCSTIGVMGNTGRSIGANGGEHLHFEILTDLEGNNGTQIDPAENFPQMWASQNYREGSCKSTRNAKIPTGRPSGSKQINGGGVD